MFPIAGREGEGEGLIKFHRGKRGKRSKQITLEFGEGWKECKNVHLGDSRKIETANFCNHLSNSN